MRSEAALLSGPVSVEARVLLELRRRRAKDHQEFAFRVGDYYFVGPMSSGGVAWDDPGRQAS
jgi:hypothetical protein